MRADEKHIRTQSAILYKTLKPCLGLTITAFSGRMVFIRPENAVGARSAQCLLIDHTCMPSDMLELLRPVLRGRRSVRADRRLRAHEKHIRTQSAISYKTATLRIKLRTYRRTR
ncbi:MAG: hypothetical protein EPO19_00555 [Betaproteobacteria bacterium]|nr:MAG: hypothetical protein EPO19_00555 [Betaproteobacteria bacterium]